MRKLIDFFLNLFKSKEVTKRRTETLDEILNEKKEENMFDVTKPKYNNQRDNKIAPYVTCFPTSVAMTVRTLAARSPRIARYTKTNLDDILIGDIQANLSKWKKASMKIGEWTKSYHPRTIWMFWSKLYFPAKMPGLSAEYASFTFEEVKEWMEDNDTPVIIGTKASKGRGHIIVIVGYNEEGFIVNDPYGNFEKGYHIEKFDGKEELYPYASKVWTWKRNPKPAKKYHCLLIERDDQV